MNIGTRFARVLAAFASAFALALPASAQETAPQAAEQAPPVEIPLEQQTALRCAAAFAIIHGRQDIGDEKALSYPPMEGRGREFMVRAAVRAIDELGLDREAVSDFITAEAAKLNEGEDIHKMMPSCLILLEASGL
ncbi:hypothetical protein [Pontixanthobacter aquaemixtae]|uniref:Uncharacterized protein n=1 Tax=Pontixanthobacter aquaemixtae TaxID=1958940 RepID=A0A844ZN88_9SPHN|nr:hypothetical protein [Pontixanthobacter aquaemixtae]MXO89228.1 hypothetical protein [Pontixanthobacter aquaemixtae]